MTDPFSEHETIAAIPGLTRSRLVAFVAAEVVIPLHTDQGPVFRQIDIARLRLLCELSDDLDLDEATLGIVISLIDQLHEARSALRAVASALAAEPADLRARIGAALLQSRH
ncbi:MAG: hypothetical protein Q7J57_08745 [Gemmobacter sp.]|nr:hypothetical protein [Gemmobacter sp.]